MTKPNQPSKDRTVMTKPNKRKVGPTLGNIGRWPTVAPLVTRKLSNKCQICGEEFYYEQGYKGHLTKHLRGVLDKNGKVTENYKRCQPNTLNARIERIILRHTKSQNSFIDESGTNHFKFVVSDLRQLFIKLLPKPKL